jgi:glutaredoxin 3
MPTVKIFTTSFCTYCVRAKRLLEHKGIAYEEIDVSNDPELRAEMIAAGGRRTVPQIFIGTDPIGGFEELRSLEQSGELDQLLGG